MRQKYIARLEAHLEQVIEGVFASLFGKQFSAQDAALRLVRAMEDNVQPASGSDPRPVAPDLYSLFASPKVQTALLIQYPNLTTVLAEHLVELAGQGGYQLNSAPQIKILADNDLEDSDLVVVATHSSNQAHSTTAMESVNIPQIRKPSNPQLIINETHHIELSKTMINIGRNRQNDIVLDDPYVSRHHIQLRLRDGIYMLFDVNSQSGTYVNGVQVKEHRLQTGDVIQMGHTIIIYAQDSETEGDFTESMDPL